MAKIYSLVLFLIISNLLFSQSNKSLEDSAIDLVNVIAGVDPQANYNSLKKKCNEVFGKNAIAFSTFSEYKKSTYFFFYIPVVKNVGMYYFDANKNMRGMYILLDESCTSCKEKMKKSMSYSGFKSKCEESVNTMFAPEYMNDYCRKLLSNRDVELFYKEKYKCPEITEPEKYPTDTTNAIVEPIKEGAGRSGKQ